MGLFPDTFWLLTYAEFLTMLEGFRKKERRHNNELLYLAWHVAAFERQKKLPPLSSVLADEDATGEPGEGRVMSDEEMMAKCRILNAAFGGTEVTT